MTRHSSNGRFLGGDWLNEDVCGRQPVRLEKNNIKQKVLTLTLSGIIQKVSFFLIKDIPQTYFEIEIDIMIVFVLTSG